MNVTIKTLSVKVTRRKGELELGTPSKEPIKTEPFEYGENKDFILKTQEIGEANRGVKQIALMNLKEGESLDIELQYITE